MTPHVAVLYEDERERGANIFPMHELVINAVADQLSVDWRDVKVQFEAFQEKGDAKLLHACEFKVPRMRHREFLAIFDSDQLHRLLKLPGNTGHTQLLSELRRRCVDPRLRLLLLERNTESLVNAAAKCLGREPPDRKSKLDRDSVLAKAAWAATVRACIRDSMPSFAAITDELTRLFVPPQRATQRGVSRRSQIETQK